MRYEEEEGGVVVVQLQNVVYEAVEQHQHSVKLSGVSATGEKVQFLAVVSLAVWCFFATSLVFNRVVMQVCADCVWGYFKDHWTYIVPVGTGVSLVAGVCGLLVVSDEVACQYRIVQILVAWALYNTVVVAVSYWIPLYIWLGVMWGFAVLTGVNGTTTVLLACFPSVRCLYIVVNQVVSTLVYFGLFVLWRGHSFDWLGGWRGASHADETFYPVEPFVNVVVLAVVALAVTTKECVLFAEYKEVTLNEKALLTLKLSLSMFTFMTPCNLVYMICVIVNHEKPWLRSRSRR